MDIYKYENRTLDFFIYFELEEVFRAPYDKPKEAYIDCLNLLCLTVKRLRSEIDVEDTTGSGQKLSNVFENIFMILNAEKDTYDSEKGFEGWITENFKNEDCLFGENKLRIDPNNNSFNHFENLLLILLLQNYHKKRKYYKNNIKQLVKEIPSESLAAFGKIIKSHRTSSDQYKTFTLNNEEAYLNAYRSLQLLFLCSSRNLVRVLIKRRMKKERENVYSEFLQEKKFTKNELNNKTLIEKVASKHPQLSAIVEFGYYYPFIRSIMLFDIKSDRILFPLKDKLGKVINEKYRLLAKPAKKLLENPTLDDIQKFSNLFSLLMNEFDYDGAKSEADIEEFELLLKEIANSDIDKYPLFNLLDSVLAEALMPGIIEMNHVFATYTHSYEDSQQKAEIYFRQFGYGKLALPHVALENKESLPKEKREYYPENDQYF